MKQRHYSEINGYHTLDVPTLTLADTSIIGTEVKPTDAAILGSEYHSKILDNGNVIGWFTYDKCPSVNGCLIGSITARVHNAKTGKTSVTLPRDALYNLIDGKLILAEVAFTNTVDRSTFAPDSFAPLAWQAK